MRYYIALIHKDAESDYGVSFPDFPGCISAGSTLDEARAMAEEALALHVAGMIEDGDPIPEPSSIETVMADAENRDGVVVLVGLQPSVPKFMRVNISVPEDVLAQMDRYADTHGYTRSGFIVHAAKKMLKAD